MFRKPMEFCHRRNSVTMTIRRFGLLVNLRLRQIDKQTNMQITRLRKRSSYSQYSDIYNVDPLGLIYTSGDHSDHPLPYVHTSFHNSPYFRISDSLISRNITKLRLRHNYVILR
jgi:hypothetical protein